MDFALLAGVMKTLKSLSILFLSLHGVSAFAVESPAFHAVLKDPKGMPISGVTVQFTAYELSSDDFWLNSTTKVVNSRTGADGVFSFPSMDLGDDGWIFSSGVPQWKKFSLCVKVSPYGLDTEAYCPIQSEYSGEDYENIFEKLRSTDSLTYITIRVPNASIQVTPWDHPIAGLASRRDDNCKILDRNTGETYGIVARDDLRFSEWLMIDYYRTARLCGTSVSHPDLQIDQVVRNLNLEQPADLALLIEHRNWTELDWGVGDQQIEIKIQLPNSPTLSDEIHALSNQWNWIRYENASNYSVKLIHPTQ